MKNRIEISIANLFKIRILKMQIEALQRENENLIFVLESRHPESVKGVDLSVLAGFGVKVFNTDYAGHKAKMEEVEILLFTGSKAEGNKYDPRDKIFSASLQELGGKI